MVEMSVPGGRASGGADCGRVSDPGAVLSAGQPSCVLLGKQMSWSIRDCCHGRDGKRPICSLTRSLCLYFISTCAFSCPGISWKSLLEGGMSDPPRGQVAV